MPPKASAAKLTTSENGAAASPSDDNSIRQAAVVSSTFANVELQTTRQTLKQYTQLYEEAREENQRIARELVERDKDSMKVVQFLRAELDGKVAEIANIKQQHKNDLDKVRSDFHMERKQLLAEVNERDDQIAVLENKISVVHGDLEALQAFAADRDRLYAEMNAFREHHKRECERYEAEISRLRFVSLEEKVRVKAEERIMTEKFDAEVADRAMKLLDVKTKEIHNENFALLQDKVILEQELDRVVEDNKNMKSITSAQRRDVELAKVADEEYAKRGARQTREIKDLRNQCKLMEANISKLIDEYEHKLEVLSHKSHSEIDKLKEERDLAYRNAEIRHKELTRMRQLSKTIVKQRSELEIFFNEALDYVRQQIITERQLQLQEKYQVNDQHRLIAAKGSSSSAPPPANGKGDQRGSSALPLAEHPFFHGAREFDSIYAAAEEGNVGQGLPPQSSASSTHRQGLPAIKPPSSQQWQRNQQQDPSSSVRSTPSQAHQQRQQTQPLPGPSAGGVLSGATDISQLSWGDKERVLRILLAKINNAARYERKELHENPNDAMHLVVPAAPKQITTKSDTFLTQALE